MEYGKMDQLTGTIVREGEPVPEKLVYRAPEQWIDVEREEADDAPWRHRTVPVGLRYYNELLYNERMLYALLDAGVQNWEGYDVAMAVLDAEDDNAV